MKLAVKLASPDFLRDFLRTWIQNERSSKSLEWGGSLGRMETVLGLLPKAHEDLVKTQERS